MELEVRGADELAVLSKRLKDAGDKALRKELLTAIRVATKDTKAQIKASALAVLPKKGGLAARIAASKFTTTTRTTGGSVGIKITAKNIHSINGMHNGRLRHRVYGGTKWVSQTVPVGWFSKPVEASAPKARDEIAKAMADVAAKLEGK